MNTIVNSGVSINWYLFLCTVLFSIGAMGVLMRRNAIIVLMCIELMLNAVNLLLVAFSTYLGGKGDGQLMVFFIMVVAAAEAAVGLAILVMVYRNTKSTDISFLDKLKG
ncbi:MAG TPA: NADH-quinone oxidoreductase subunit NuoK [Flavobacteriales bacterium]|nr:NADH-quinone oxidoreductase subunit NuoK [Flavobacteriales bacterium]